MRAENVFPGNCVGVITESVAPGNAEVEIGVVRESAPALGIATIEIFAKAKIVLCKSHVERFIAHDLEIFPSKLLQLMGMGLESAGGAK